MRTSRNPENTIPSQNPQKETTYTAFDHFEHSLSTTLCNVSAPLHLKFYVNYLPNMLRIIHTTLRKTMLTFTPYKH